MADPRVPKHFIVAPWTPGVTEADPLGHVGQPYNVLYADVEAAKTKAKELAADTPGTIWVVYAAIWYAWTDETPVNLQRVIGAALT